MIRVNLCPVDELESPYWWVGEAIVGVVILISSYVGVQVYLGTIQDQIDVAVKETEILENSYRKLEPDIKKFENLDNDIKELNNKLVALQAITVSKVSRYRPVIAIEHLQNLKPDGVWFQSFTLGADNTLELKGQAFDNILVAELMVALKYVANQEAFASDLRTQVYFDDVSLVESIVQGADPDFPELRDYPRFTLKMRVIERPVHNPQAQQPIAILQKDLFSAF